MEYIYAAMILHSAEKDINEENVKSIIEAAEIDANRILEDAERQAEQLARKLVTQKIVSSSIEEEYAGQDRYRIVICGANSYDKKYYFNKLQL